MQPTPGDATRRRTADRFDTGPPWLEPVASSIHERVSEPVRVVDLAMQAGVHPVHLARTFRRHYGCTIGEYSRRLRIERARHALADGDRSICAIALSNGFSDQAHFTRRFKELIGVPPGEYRRRVAN